MPEDSYGDKLSYFKANEKPEVVLLVADDPSRVKITVAWTNTRVTRARQVSVCQGDSESEVWDWLWSNASYSQEELRLKSALPKYDFEAMLIPLIGNRVLYPDGTVNSFVQRYLRDRILGLFEAKPKRPTARRS